MSTQQEPAIEAAKPAKPARKGPRQRRPGLVEVVRLIILALFTGGGLAIADGFQLHDISRSVAIALGVLLGYVAGGVFGRSTVAALDTVERRFKKATAAEILAGTVGLILGLVIALLVTLPLLRLKPIAAYPTIAFMYLVLALVGYRVGSTKRDDFFALLGMKPRAAGGPVDLTVVDTSALIDGRITDVVRSGFLGGTLLIPDGVLHELRVIGDSSDPGRRERGRRGLAAIERLQQDPEVEVVLVDNVPEFPGDDVDAALVKLARTRRAALCTNDAQLAKVAEAVGVTVRSVNRLAGAVRPAVGPGQEVTLKMVKAGREADQGLGYLDDGTMVVVHGGAAHMGEEVHVRVTNVLNTANGRIMFAELLEPDGG
jgi:uncharacterized protein YacL